MAITTWECSVCGAGKDPWSGIQGMADYCLNGHRDGEPEKERREPVFLNIMVSISPELLEHENDSSVIAVVRQAAGDSAEQAVRERWKRGNDQSG